MGMRDLMIAVALGVSWCSAASAQSVPTPAASVAVSESLLHSGALVIPPVVLPLMESPSARAALLSAVTRYQRGMAPKGAHARAFGNGRTRRHPDEAGTGGASGVVQLADGLVQVVRDAPSSTSALTARLVLARELSAYPAMLPALASSLEDIRVQAPGSWQSSMAFLFDGYLQFADAQAAGGAIVEQRAALEASRQSLQAFFQAPRPEPPVGDVELEHLRDLVGAERLTLPLKATMALSLANREYALAQLDQAGEAQLSAARWQAARAAYERVLVDHPGTHVAERAGVMLHQVARYEQHGPRGAPAIDG